MAVGWARPCHDHCNRAWRSDRISAVGHRRAVSARQRHFISEAKTLCFRKLVPGSSPVLPVALRWFQHACEEPMASPEQTLQDASKSPLLWGLPEHLSRDLFKGATPVRLRVDQILFHAGDAGDGCYRVDDGLLKVNMLSPSGNERILCFLGPSAVVGELSMIDGLPRSASVVAVRPATLSFLSRDAFKAFAKKHPELYEYLVMLLAGRLRETDAVIAAGSFLPNKGRL